MTERDEYTPTWFEIRERVEHDTYLTADEADAWLAEHDAKVRAEEREKCAQIAENLYFGGGATGSANRWGAKQAAARIREQGS